MEVEDYAIVLANFVSKFYYGPVFRIVLPMQYKSGISDYRILSDNESYSPLPYVVAEYKLVGIFNDEFSYEFIGVKIINND